MEKSVASSFREMWNCANDLAKRELESTEIEGKERVKVTKALLNNKRRELLNMMLKLSGVDILNEGCSLNDHDA
jgi:hypothetical protein